MKKRMHVAAMAIAGMSVMAVFGITCPEVDFNLYMTTSATNAPDRKVSSAQQNPPFASVPCILTKG